MMDLARQIVTLINSIKEYQVGEVGLDHFIDPYCFEYRIGSVAPMILGGKDKICFAFTPDYMTTSRVALCRESILHQQLQYFSYIPALT